MFQGLSGTEQVLDVGLNVHPGSTQYRHGLSVIKRTEIMVEELCGNLSGTALETVIDVPGVSSTVSIC